jgi:hypothetical protein
MGSNSDVSRSFGRARHQLTVAKRRMSNFKDAWLPPQGPPYCAAATQHLDDNVKSCLEFGQKKASGGGGGSSWQDAFFSGFGGMWKRATLGEESEDVHQLAKRGIPDCNIYNKANQDMVGFRCDTTGGSQFDNLYTDYVNAGHKCDLRYTPWTRPARRR